MVMWLTLTQINESSCGHDIGMISYSGHDIGTMGMWVWVDFNANQRIVTSTNRHVAQPTIRKSTNRHVVLTSA